MFEVCNFCTVGIGGIFLLPTVPDKALKRENVCLFFHGRNTYFSGYLVR